MKKNTLLMGFVLFVCSNIACVDTLDRSTTFSQAAQKRIPKILNVSIREITGSEAGNIRSIFLPNDESLVVTLDTKFSIVRFTFSSDGHIEIVDRYQSSKWPLNDIIFTDALNGFAVGHYGTLLKTDDSGKTWNQMPRVSDYDLNQSAFLNQTIGYVAGREAIINKTTQELETKVEIWKTENGGNIWTRSYQSNGESEVFQIVVFSPEIALASINGNRLIRTIDGGRTWKEVAVNGKSVMSLALGSDGVLWVVGYEGSFLKSIDKGESWEDVKGLPNELFNRRWKSISFGKAGNGLAVSEEGIIAYTSDNGITWEKLPKEFDEPLRKVDVYAKAGIILGANNIYRVDFLQ